ncbi:tyrosine-type recombinase/integrase [Alphaproteobacteria bacterium]|nr:tyrosine-type recombinase/integrase [Alphaproteobacteria bacterium]
MEKAAEGELVWFRGKWAIYYYDPNTQKAARRSTRTTDRELAEGILQEWNAKLRQPTDTTVSSILDYRYQAVASSLEAPEAMVYNMNVLKHHLGHIDASRLTKSDYSAFIDKRRPHLPAARRELATLNAAIRLALEENIISEGVIAKRPKPPPPREHYATKEQATQLIAHPETSPHLRLFVQLASLTGRRSGAVLDLTWERVLFDINQIDFKVPGEQVTTKRRGVCRMNTALKRILLSAYEDRTCAHVIAFRGKRIRSIKKSFGRQRDKVGLPEWLTPHVLRHSVASWLAMDKLTSDQIADITDLDPDTVRRVYRKFNPDYLREEMETLGSGFDW